MDVNKIWCESNEVTLTTRLGDKSLDGVITSPFYNTNVNAKGGRTLLNFKTNGKYEPNVRYDVFVDVMSNDDYSNYCCRLFDSFDRVVKDDGIVVWNVSYGNNNADCLILTLSDILRKTNWTTADIICWKKPTAMPNTPSPNKLTRVWEFVYVFCKKGHESTFKSNKKTVSLKKDGSGNYENIPNFIEAKNNDGVCPFNKATYSSDLVKKIIDLYFKKGDIIYDPFMGSGTTAVGCKEKGINYIGSEISENQVEWAERRIKNTGYQQTLW